MDKSRPRASSRRDFLKTTGQIAAASALLGTAIPRVHAGESNTIQLVLVGCGGRGTGAAADALSVENVPMKLVAMADIFEQRVKGSHGRLKKVFGDKVDVPEDRLFVGFDGYKKAMDCLKPGDIAIFATPPGFRWVHFGYAIEKGLNVFMEKPVTVDGPSTRRMLKLAEASEKKNLKVGVGLMVRHCRGRRQLFDRIQSGEIGDIVTMRAYRMEAGGGRIERRTPELTEPLFQAKHFHSFIWASGGMYSDCYIHQIDECSWMKNAWPVQAQALGGRHYRYNYVDQNFDSYAVEYTFADGAKFFYSGRLMNGCQNQFASYAHGTKGAAIISASSHSPGRVRTFRHQTMDKASMIWAFPQPEPNPYHMEWMDLVEAIVQDKPYNEARRGAEASLVTSMGRMAAHTGQIITYDQMLHCEHDMAPDLDKLTENGPAPLMPDANGKYPIPQPGLVKDREY